jgi:putative phosphoribosyl transferase
VQFQSRIDAGHQLAIALSQYKGKKATIVLALPRGGVPVAYEIAKELNLPLDVFIVRKLGAPGCPELAMGAIASGGYCDLNKEIIQEFEVSHEMLEDKVNYEAKELQRRTKLYRDDLPALDLKNQTVILVDDGLATGASMRVAIRAIRAMNPKTMIVAVPVSAASSKRELSPEVDRFVSLNTPEHLRAVGYWYEDFSQTTDEEVCALISRARKMSH